MGSSRAPTEEQFLLFSYFGTVGILPIKSFFLLPEFFLMKVYAEQLRRSGGDVFLRSHFQLKRAALD